MRYAALVVLIFLAAPAFAVGGNDEAPPTPTQTSTDCTKGQIWDEKSKTCIDAKDSRLDDDSRMKAVCELAWSGQPERALAIFGHCAGR